jgi:hypothetical protein
MRSLKTVTKLARGIAMPLLGCAIAAASCGGSEGDDLGNAERACGVGDTRPCTGPAQCAGSQTCLPNRSGFGDCDCGAAGSGGSGGASGGSGGSGGSTGTGGSVSTGGSGGLGGGSGGSSGSGGASGAGAGGIAGTDAGLDGSGTGGTGSGGADPGNDPCDPNTTINCATDCGGRTASCAEIECTSVWPFLEITSTSMLPLVVRTPSKSGVPCDCSALPAIVPRAALLFRNESPTTIRVTVGEPWRLKTHGSYQPHPCGAWPVGVTGCVIVETPPDVSNDVNLMVATDDPLAPARNILFEQVPDGTTCP